MDFMLLEMLAYYPSTTFRPTTSSSKSLTSSVAFNCQGNLSSLGSIVSWDDTVRQNCVHDGLQKLLVVYWLGLSVAVRVRARDGKWIFHFFFFPLH